MKTIDRFKNALENFNSPYFVEDLTAYDKRAVDYVSLAELRLLIKKIKAENENKISDYNIENFEKDFEFIISNLVEAVENPNKQNTTHYIWDFISEFYHFYVDNNILRVKLANLSCNDFYFLPEFVDAYSENGNIKLGLVKINPVPIKNSFSDLFLQKFKESDINYYFDHLCFYNLEGQPLNYQDGLDLFCEINLKSLEKVR